MRRPGPAPLRALAVALGLLLAGLGGGCAGEDIDALLLDDPRGDDEWLRGDALEQEAWEAFGAGKNIRAREKAEEALKERPGSFLANWVLSQIMHREEGHHPRARFLLSRTRAMLERRFGARPESQLAKTWHKRILNAEVSLLGEMDDREGELRVIAEHDALYAPSLKAQTIWALLKLKRFDEAIATAESLLYSDELYDRISAYNGIMATYDKMLDKTKSYEWGVKGIEVTQGRHCILLHNTAEAALMFFRFKEAEDFARRAVRAEYDDCPGTSYEHLVTLYLTLGEFQKAISAYKRVLSYPTSPRFRPMLDKNNKHLMTEILYALGKYEQALDYAKVVFSAPDRAGILNYSEEDIRFGHGILYWLTLDARLRELADEASVLSMPKRISARWERKDLELKRWEVGRIVKSLAAREDLLVANLRPFLRHIRPWYAGGLGRIFGAGVATAALREARLIEAEHLDEPAMAYFDALEAEFAFHDGDWERARDLGRGALKKLSPENAILVARTQAVIAESSRQLGADPDGAESVALLKAVLQRFPMVLRYLDIRLHTKVMHDGSPEAEAIAELLHRHNRFDTDTEAAFVVDVSTPGEGRAELCLRASAGFQFGCKRVDFNSDEEKDVPEEDRPARALSVFVADVFSPRVELTSSDINSLDGSPTRQSADDALKGILRTRVIEEDK